MKPIRYVYQYMDGKHGFLDQNKDNFWKDTFFTTESRARLWINEKNKEERRQIRGGIGKL